MTVAQEQLPQRETAPKFEDWEKFEKPKKLVEKPLPEPELPPVKKPLAVIDGRLVSAIGEIDGRYVFDEREKKMLIDLKKKQKKSVKVKKITKAEMPNLEISKGMIYTNLNEAIDHLEKGKIPQSRIIPDLQEKLAEALEKLNNMKDLEQRLEKLEAKEEVIFREE